MWDIVKKITFATLGVLGTGTLMIVPVSAEADNRPRPRQPATLLRPQSLPYALSCWTIPATRSLTLVPNQIGADASSTTSYGIKGCDAFVVDIRVTSASTPPAGYLASFSFFHEPNQGIGIPNRAKCTSTDISVSYWRKADGQTAFSSVGGGKIKGVWLDNPPPPGFPCSLDAQPGFKRPPTSFNLPSGGKVDVYRVVISSKQNSAKTVVKAGLAHLAEQ